MVYTVRNAAYFQGDLKGYGIPENVPSKDIQHHLTFIWFTYRKPVSGVPGSLTIYIPKIVVRVVIRYTDPGWPLVA